MQDGGLEPDMSTYGGLLYSCGQGGLHKAAKKIHRHMLHSNVIPTADGFTGKLWASSWVRVFNLHG
jgi:pentatricopeptide repeat protein